MNKTLAAITKVLLIRPKSLHLLMLLLFLSPADRVAGPAKAHFRSHPGDPELPRKKPRQQSLQSPVSREREHRGSGLGGCGEKDITVLYTLM